MRWCVESSSVPLECGPARSRDRGGSKLLKDECTTYQDQIIKIIPQISPESSLFYPSWVKRNGRQFTTNNVYLIIGSDGLDPVFGKLNDLIVM